MSAPKALKARGGAVKLGRLRAGESRTIRLRLTIGRTARVGTHVVTVRMRVGRETVTQSVQPARHAVDGDGPPQLGSSAAKRASAAGVAPGRAVAEADDRRLECGEAADLVAVEGRVGVKRVGGSWRPGRPLSGCWPKRTSAAISVRSASRQREIRPGEWPGVSSTVKRADLVALAQPPRDRHRRPGPLAQLPARDRVERRAVAQVAGLDRVGVDVAGQHRHAQLARECGAGALVVGVGVGDHVAGELLAGELAHDPPPPPAGRGVDHVAVREVDVDRVARRAAQQVETVGDVLHAGVYGTTLRNRGVRFAARWLTIDSTASWIVAGIEALEEGGTEAVSASALAKRLGVTRGSFYWHFDSRDELLQAVLDRWERDHSDAVLAALAAVPDPRERLRLLVDAATSKPPSLFIRLLEAQTREPAAATVLNRSRARRVDFLAQAYRELGLRPAAARRRALAVYAAYVGIAQLVSADEGLLAGRERSAFARELAAMVVPPPMP